MTGESPSSSRSPAPPADGLAGWTQRWESVQRRREFRRLDHWLESGSDWLSPILVKEARQAIKSQRFLATFFAMILAGWAWSLFAVGVQTGAGMRSGMGQMLLMGYLVILALPLTVVIPFSAFYSLSRELQSGSLELTMLTRLPALWIVLGKLGSVVLQIGVYLSALAPFMCLAYLMRGVDLLSIWFFLLINIVLSLSLSCLALLLAAGGKTPAAAVGATVLTAAGCVLVGLGWSFPMQLELVEEAIPWDDPEFAAMLAATLGLTAAVAGVVVLSAAAAIDFPSKNRATPIRWALLVLLAALVGWTITGWVATEDNDFFYIGLVMAFIVLGLAGAAINSERPELSLRAQRALPVTAMGRLWLSWLRPGSATGYVFVVLCGVSFVLAVTLADWINTAFEFNSNLQRIDSRYRLASAVWCIQLTLYLGLGRLLVVLVRRWMNVEAIGSLLLHAGLLVLGAAAPTLVNVVLAPGTFNPMLQSINWAWAMGGSLERNIDLEGVFLIALPLALGVLACNLLAAAPEVVKRRAAAPARVQRDDLERRPSPPEHPVNPLE